MDEEEVDMGRGKGGGEVGVGRRGVRVSLGEK